MNSQPLKCLGRFGMPVCMAILVAVSLAVCMALVSAVRILAL